MFTQYEYYALPYKHHPLLPPHTDSKMFLVICELIDKLWRSLVGDRDGADSTISYRLNKAIVGVNIRSPLTELLQYVFMQLTIYPQFEQLKKNLL